MIGEEVKQLKEDRLVSEIKHLTWMDNVVMVKWRMFFNFTDLNLAWPKDPYPMPNINILIDIFLVYMMLNFIDAY